MENETQIVIGVPGKWPNRDSLVMDVANNSNGLLFVGMALMEIATNEGYLLEVHEHDPDLAKSFEIAGRLRMAPADIQPIRSHTFTLYLTAKGGSLEQAQKVLNVGCGLLHAGGLAVTVEPTHRNSSAHTYLN